MLAYDLSRPRGASDGATVAVLLHGRGSHRGDLQALRAYLPTDWVLVTPQAPHPGHRWGYGPGWAWYHYFGDDLIEDAGLEWSLSAVDRFLARLPAVVTLRPGRILLGGFSQGGTVSLAYALTRPGVAAAVLNFSGFLVDSRVVPLHLSGAQEAHVFWAHGTRDPAVPHDLAVRGRARLAEAGIPVTARDYDIGHWIDPQEIADAVAFLDGGG